MSIARRGVIALEEAAIAMQVALEEAATGVANNEVELVFYAQLSAEAEAVLKQAKDIEAHEQWELRIEKSDENASAGRFRVRKTVVHQKDGQATESQEPEYVLTSKTKLPNGSENEVAVTSSVDQFAQFKAMSGRGMIKVRHTYPIEGRPDLWEVDVYPSIEGNLWVKIDLEITDGNMEVPAFPAGLLDESTIITNKGATDEVKAQIRQLYDDVFITRHQG